MKKKRKRRKAKRKGKRLKEATTHRQNLSEWGVEKRE